jgi:hypothetical protein
MGAAVTKFHADDKGMYVFDEVCPGMKVEGAGSTESKCSAPAASKDDEFKKLAAKKFYLVSDPVANPQMGAFVPFPVGQQGFFLDSQDAEGKDLSADPAGFQKTIYAMTNIRDPTQMGQDAVSALQVPTAWCAHIKPCPAGVRCCPEVTPAVPALSVPKQAGQALQAVAAGTPSQSIFKSKTAKVIYLILLLVALYFIYTRFLARRGGRRAPPAEYADF